MKLQKIVWGSTEVVDEALGAGDGVKTTFAGTLANDHLHHRSLTVTAGAQTLTDDGAGNLTGDGTGTINYVTGAFSVTFDAAPASGVGVLGDYTYFPTELLFRMPFHSPMPRRNWVGSHVEVPSGLIEAWQDGLYPELEFEQHWIPGGGAALQSGWYGAGGVEEFLVWARDAKEFRMFLDKADAAYHTCQAVPSSVEEGRESSKAQFFWFRMKARDVAGEIFQI